MLTTSLQGAAASVLAARKSGSTVTLVSAIADSVALCAAAITNMCRDADLVVDSIAVTRRGGGLAASLGESTADVVVIAEAQWANERLLGDVVDALTARGRHVAMLHRRGAMSRTIAEIQLLPTTTTAEIAPFDESELCALGLSRPDAANLIDATGGHPDLVEYVRNDTLPQVVTARLALVDDATRRVAELLAFGVALQRALRAVPDADDAAGTTLEVEGLVIDGAMVSAVASGVRMASTPRRREAMAVAALSTATADELTTVANHLCSLADDSRAACEIYCEVASILAGGDPASALRFIDAATQRGAADDRLRLVEVRAALAAGEPQRAVRVAAAIEATDETQMLCAAAWVAVGDWVAAADSLTQARQPGLAAWAQTALGASSLETTGARAADALASAVRAWLDGDAVEAGRLADLAMLRSIAEPESTWWPVSAHDVAARFAVGRGDVTTAAAITAEALAAGTATPWRDGGLRLLSAWLAARRGLLDHAADLIGGIGALSPADRCLLAAVRCAIAVRDAAAGELEAAADDGLGALRSYGVGLYDIDVVGDIAAAVHRAGLARSIDMFDRLSTHAERSASPAVAFDLGWIQLSVALAGGDSDAVKERAAALVVIGETTNDVETRTPHLHARLRAARALCGGSGHDAQRHAAHDDALATAKALADQGWMHEAARFCGHLALHATDELTTRALLKESRAWRAQRATLRSASVERTIGRLSEQEHAVARMVLDGHTHKQIGASLYISPKTVEHHVAHIRTKLGASSRAEMMASIRAYLADGSDSPTSPS